MKERKRKGKQEFWREEKVRGKCSLVFSLVRLADLLCVFSCVSSDQLCSRRVHQVNEVQETHTLTHEGEKFRRRRDKKRDNQTNRKRPERQEDKQLLIWKLFFLLAPLRAARHLMWKWQWGILSDEGSAVGEEEIREIKEK